MSDSCDDRSSMESDPIERMLQDYVYQLRLQLLRFWESWPLDMSRRPEHEVLGGLLARLVSLTTQLAGNPSIWNHHIAPLILRAMADAHITLAWIAGDPAGRAAAFIDYGLGQQKLEIEWLKQMVQQGRADSAVEQQIKSLEAWLNAQRFEYLTCVNVGSWSGTTTRDMATEAGCMDVYNYVYMPYSAATHSMWHHISKCNLIQCDNPLHRYHRIPSDKTTEPQFWYFYQAARIVDDSFQFACKQLSVSAPTPSAFDSLYAAINAIPHGSQPDTL